MSIPADEVTTSASLGPVSRKQLIAGILFAAAALYLATVVPTVEIAWVTGILLFTIYLFAFEVVEVDVAAATVMVLLGLTSLLAPVMGLERGLVDTQQLFDGFSSNAVISIIAVMIIGAGLDKTGLMSQVASFILAGVQAVPGGEGGAVFRGGDDGDGAIGLKGDIPVQAAGADGQIAAVTHHGDHPDLVGVLDVIELLAHQLAVLGNRHLLHGVLHTVGLPEIGHGVRGLAPIALGRRQHEAACQHEIDDAGRYQDQADGGDGE